MTTTSYGTWNNHGDRFNVTVEATIADAVTNADSEWIEAMETAGAFKRIAAAYRDEINEALPSGVSLAGNDFYGPYAPEAEDFDGYLHTGLDEGEGELDIAGIVEGIDLQDIIEAHDVPALVQDAHIAENAALRAADAAQAEAMNRAEAVAKVVDAVGGNQAAAAELLGIDSSRVSRLVTKARRTRPVTLIAAVAGEDMSAILGVPAYLTGDPDRPLNAARQGELAQNPRVKEFLAAHAGQLHRIFMVVDDVQVPDGFPSVTVDVRA